MVIKKESLPLTRVHLLINPNHSSTYTSYLLATSNLIASPAQTNPTTALSSSSQVRIKIVHPISARHNGPSSHEPARRSQREQERHMHHACNSGVERHPSFL